MPFYTTCPKTDMPFNTIALKQTWLFTDMTFYTTAHLQFSPYCQLYYCIRIFWKLPVTILYPSYLVVLYFNGQRKPTTVRRQSVSLKPTPTLLHWWRSQIGFFPQQLCGPCTRFITALDTFFVTIYSMLWMYLGHASLM